MKIIKEISIRESVENSWEILGNQFGEIDKWSSFISHSELSGKVGIGVVRSIENPDGNVKQKMTSFNPEKHSLSYKPIAGIPFFAKGLNVKWSLFNEQGNNSKLTVDFEVMFKGIGGILSPIVKKKLGKVIDGLLEEFKYYVENGKPHPRTLTAVGSK